ncbi:MAG: ZmpA/ZmpB/ZmpC family metallo-endopeptidase-related protein, partial [Christensenella sp.]
MKNSKRKMTAVAITLVIMLSFGAIGFAAATGEPSQPSPTSSAPSQTSSTSSAPSQTSSASSAPSADASAQQTEQSTPSAQPSFLPEETIPIKVDIVLNTPDDVQKIGREEGYPADGTYALHADIDGKNADFASIANFSGSINGNGHKIMNANIHGSGLFEVLSGSVSALNLENITVTGEKTAGILAGTITGEAKIEDVFITGKITANADGAIGGVAGTIDGAAVFARVQVYADIQSESKTAGAFAGTVLKSDKQSVFADCLWSNAYGQDTAFGL